jgi:hypothetical protein
LKSNKLLLDDYPLVVIPELANKLGLNEAIILQQVHYWVVHNTGKEKNFQEGYYWTYNTYNEWQSQFYFLSERTIRRAIKRLESLGYLIVGNYNKRKSDRTKWYRVDYSLLDVASPSGQVGQAKSPDRPVQSASLDNTLPETNTETISKTTPEKKHPYGTFYNVYLTRWERDKLITRYGSDKYVEWIEELSHAIESKGYKYKSHYATILNWARREKDGTYQQTTEARSAELRESIGKPMP